MSMKLSNNTVYDAYIWVNVWYDKNTVKRCKKVLETFCTVPTDSQLQALALRLNIGEKISVEPVPRSIRRFCVQAQ